MFGYNILGNSNSYCEESNAVGSPSRARFVLNEDTIFTAETAGNVRKGLQQENFLISNRNGVNPMIETIDEVTTWQPGDNILYFLEGGG